MDRIDRAVRWLRLVLLAGLALAPVSLAPSVSAAQAGPVLTSAPTPGGVVLAAEGDDDGGEEDEESELDE